MKRTRGDLDPTISLFPHEFRARQIVAMILSFRYAEPGSAMAQVPRDVVRMICGWVKADFTVALQYDVQFWSLRKSSVTQTNTGVVSYDFIWMSHANYDRASACSQCLSVIPYTLPFLPPKSWCCDHRVKSCYGLNEKEFKQLEKKYILRK